MDVSKTKKLRTLCADEEKDGVYFESRIRHLPAAGSPRQPRPLVPSKQGITTQFRLLRMKSHTDPFSPPRELRRSPGKYLHIFDHSKGDSGSDRINQGHNSGDNLVLISAT